MVDPALSEVASIYARGDLVLFVGAGVSAAAGLPSWGKLVDQLSARAEARGVTARDLAEVRDLVNQQKLIDALSALKIILGPGDFCVAIEQSLDDKSAAVPEVAKAIASLQGLRAIITTNIDRLLERAFAGEWDATAHPAAGIAQGRGFILKLHGTLKERSTWVFTREDYDRVMFADPARKKAFETFFNAYTLLFVGYGLSDGDFDAVLAEVRAYAGDHAPRHFALVDRQTITTYRRNTIEKAGVRLIGYDNPDGRHAEVPRILRSLAGGGGAPQVASQTTEAAPPQVTATPPKAVSPPPVAPAAGPRVPLPHTEILKIHAAAVRLSLGRSRAVLLGGIDLTVTDALPSEQDPAGQLLRDLTTLNGIGLLADGTAPLATWLANATALAGVRAESAVFKSAIAMIEGR